MQYDKKISIIWSLKYYTFIAEANMMTQQLQLFQKFENSIEAHLRLNCGLIQFPVPARDMTFFSIVLAWQKQQQPL